MIVVIGSASLWPAEEGGADEVGGRAVAIAAAAAAAGATVQLVSKLGDDAAGDAVVLALGRAGIGHAALLRDAGHPTPIVAAASAGGGAASGGEEEPETLEADGGSLIETMLATEPDDEAAPVAEELVLPGDAAERPRLEAADVELALRYLPDVSVVVIAESVDVAVADAVVAGAAYSDAAIVAVVGAGEAVPSALAAATVLEAPGSDPDGAFSTVVGRYAAALDAGVEPAAAFRGVIEGAGWEPSPGSEPAPV